MMRLKPGREATWTTEHGLAVPVRIVAFSGHRNRDAQIVVMRDTFDELAGFRAGERVAPVPRAQLSAD